MTSLFLVFGLLGVLTLGFTRLWRALSSSLHERTEVESYIQVFTRYMQSRGADTRRASFTSIAMKAIPPAAATWSTAASCYRLDM